MIRILFVCLGNICRSPLAEAQFKHAAAARGMAHLFEADSSGTASYHTGKQPDPRSLKVAGDNNIQLSHKGRQLQRHDFYDFDYMLVMDTENYRDVQRARPADARCEILYLRLFDAHGNGSNTVPDPYYGTHRDFETMYEQIHHSVNGLLDYLTKKHKLCAS